MTTASVALFIVGLLPGRWTDPAHWASLTGVCGRHRFWRPVPLALADLESDALEPKRGNVSGERASPLLVPLGERGRSPDPD
jgi:hypothetical protein